MSSDFRDSQTKCSKCGHDQNPSINAKCEICGNQLKKAKTSLFIYALIFALLAIGGSSYVLFKDKLSSLIPNATNQKSLNATLSLASLRIGTLGEAKNFESLVNHLRSNFENKVEISIVGDDSISYSEIRNRLARKQVDIIFTLSPMLSVAAKENGYIFAARMFPDKPNYYQGALFVSSTSPIQSINDLNKQSKIALGDFNSASSFYMPIFDLYGKELNISMGHRGKEIRELVKSGQADIGAGALDSVKDLPEFRVIHVSVPIPGSNVYISPTISKADREIIKQAMLNAPPEVQKNANYGLGEDLDYSGFLMISRRTEEVLSCSNLLENPVRFFCSNRQDSKSQSTTKSIRGRIVSATNINDRNVRITVIDARKNTYQTLISRSLMAQVPDASNLIAIQNRMIELKNVSPRQNKNGIFEVDIAKPEQMLILPTSAYK